MELASNYSANKK